MDKIPTRKFAIYISGKNNSHLETHHTHLPASIGDIESYILVVLAPKSIYKELLLSRIEKSSRSIKTGKDGKVIKSKDNMQNKRWRLCEMRSNNQLHDITSDKHLNEIVSRRADIVYKLRVRFDTKYFREWQQKQLDAKLIPTPKIRTIEPDSDNNGDIKIYVDYPKKEEAIYQLRYVYFENDFEPNQNGMKWHSCSQPVIRLSDLWMFKQYTVQVCVENKFSQKRGEIVKRRDIERLKHGTIPFNPHINDEKKEEKDKDYNNQHGNENAKNVKNSKNVKNVKNGKNSENSKTKGADILQDFEMRNHSQFYDWCQTELRENLVFADIRDSNDSGDKDSIIVEWMLSMIQKCDKLNGSVFLWHGANEKEIIGDLFEEKSTLDAFSTQESSENGKISKNVKNIKNSKNSKSTKNSKKNKKSKKGESKNKKRNFKHGLTRDLCLSVLSRLRRIAFAKKTNFGFAPSNPYVVYFWFFFQSMPDVGYYLRCKTPFQHGM